MLSGMIIIVYRAVPFVLHVHQEIELHLQLAVLDSISVLDGGNLKMSKNGQTLS